jgi:hypothetical protein
LSADNSEAEIGQAPSNGEDDVPAQTVSKTRSLKAMVESALNESR